MRILMISAEGPPLQRTGALIDVMNALPRELRERLRRAVETEQFELAASIRDQIKGLE